jgi:hypothetical protein
LWRQDNIKISGQQRRKYEGRVGRELRKERRGRGGKRGKE